MDIITYALFKKALKNKQIKEIKIDEDRNIVITLEDGTESVVGKLEGDIYWTDVT